LKITIAGIIIAGLSLVLLFISIRSIQKDRLGIRSGLIWIILWIFRYCGTDRSDEETLNFYHVYRDINPARTSL
jgi:hypothetical protein